MHLAKDVVVIDDIKLPNMGHITRGKPPNVTRKTQHLYRKLTELFISLNNDIIFFFKSLNIL